MKFTDWIQLIVASRSGSNRQSNKSDAIRSGLNETFRTGTWLIGEIATAPFCPDDYQTGNAQLLLLFLEQLGSDETRFPEAHEQLMEFLDQAPVPSPDPRIRLGASPHAPYSVHPGLLRQICSVAESRSKPVAMHIAETRDEIELVERQSGSFVQLLKNFGVWNPNPSQSHQSILQILKQVAMAPRSLVIHGNYLAPQELDFISNQNSRMSVVYCPRTHHYFGHEPYPLLNMLKRQINVALGTDSRASNPDLDLFRELKFVADAFDLEPERILDLGTINGAKALGLNEHYGSLTVGKNAAMSFVKTHGNKIQSSGESMFSSDSTCTPIEIAADDSLARCESARPD